jgi:hypothetical protein
MNVKISATELKKKFIYTFKNERIFSYEHGNPFLIKYKGKEFHVFLKNISSAYYEKYPDNARVQLPYSNHFKKIFKSKLDFIILGYDSEFETFSAWDPSLIKKRLNIKGNVSLFTRFSFQEKCKMNEFSTNHISDGTKIILFSVNSTPLYFKSFKSLFARIEDRVKEITKNQLTFNLFNSKEKLEVIDDKTLLRKLKLLIKNDKVLEAVNICAIHYQEDYPKMELKDWFDLIEKI